MQRSRVARMSTVLFNQRKQDKQRLESALSGLRISEVDIDNLYSKILRSKDLVKEFKK